MVIFGALNKEDLAAFARKGILKDIEKMHEAWVNAPDLGEFFDKSIRSLRLALHDAKTYREMDATQFKYITWGGFLIYVLHGMPDLPEYEDVRYEISSALAPSFAHERVAYA